MKYRKLDLSKTALFLFWQISISIFFYGDISSKNLSDTLEYEDGIYVEALLPKGSSQKDYNNDNVIFVTNRKFYYNYQYSKNNIYYKFKTINNKEWKLICIEKDSSDIVKKDISDIVTEIRITTLAGLEPFLQFDSTYRQTVIKFDYITSNGVNVSQSTGVIENKKNLWIHPPRIGLFRILELNPFPFIQRPFVIGNEWGWELKIGDTWGDSRWLTWKGMITNIYKYKIVGKETLQTNMGSLDCIVVDAEANSEIGKTFLRSYYNERYGFVKCSYINIDKSTMLLELFKVED